MNAIEYINNNLNPRELLEYYGFQNINETEQQIRCSCAIHGGNNPTAFVWNKSNNLWFCYTGECGGGDAITLVEKIEHIKFNEAVNKLASILGLDISGMEIQILEDRIKIENLKWLKRAMKNITTIETTSSYSLPYTRYWQEDSRFNRFKSTTSLYFEAKFCNVFPTENKLYKNKLVIPIYKDKQVIGVALRSLDDTLPKWIYNPAGVKLGSVLYNYDYVKEMVDNNSITNVVLVEGIFDVWAYHEAGIKNVLAVFGSHMSNEQKNLILELGVDIITSFDNDDAGIKATKQVEKEFKNLATVEHIELEEGKDPADSISILRERYENRKR